MRIGLLVTGDTSIRAAHSLSAHPGVDSVLVIGPASSKSFEVADSAEGCDYLVGIGQTAPRLAARHGVPLVWDGDEQTDGVAVWGAGPKGLAMALGSRESDPQLVAVAHPGLEVDGTERSTRFPDPVGRLPVAETRLGGRPLAVAHSKNQYAACLAVGARRRVAIVDDGAFLAGIALAAGVAVAVVGDTPRPVWAAALPYLEAATEMGLVMAESG